MTTPRPSIVAQFTNSLSSGYPQGWTKVSAYDFYVEGPKRLQAIEAVGRATLHATISGQSKVVASMHSETESLSKMIADELQQQTLDLAQAFSSSIAEVSDAVRESTGVICDGLREISWGLAQVSDKLDTLIYLQKNKRNVEAQELLKQALLHLRAENYDFADERLRIAFDKDNTDYAVLYNLGVVAIFRDQAEEAEKFFKLCARVPENVTNVAKARALFSLARTQFILNHTDKAVDTMREVLELDPTARNRFYLAIYLFHAHKPTEAVKILREAIFQDDGLFATATGYEDLAPFSDTIAAALDELNRAATENFRSARITCNDLQTNLLRQYIEHFTYAPPSRALQVANNLDSKADLGSYSAKVKYARIVNAVQSTAAFCEQELEADIALEAIETKRTNFSASLHEATSRVIAKPHPFFIDNLYWQGAAGCLVGFAILSMFGQSVADDSIFFSVLGSILFSAIWPLIVFVAFMYLVNGGKDALFGFVLLASIAAPIVYGLIRKATSNVAEDIRDSEVHAIQQQLAESSSQGMSLETKLADIRREIAARISPFIEGTTVAHHHV